jgi:chromosome segregation ATPase
VKGVWGRARRAVSEAVLAVNSHARASTIKPSTHKNKTNFKKKALEAEVAALQGRVDAATAEHGAAAARLEATRARLRECDAEIRALDKEREALARQLQDADVERRRLDNKCVVLFWCCLFGWLFVAFVCVYVVV